MKKLRYFLGVIIFMVMSSSIVYCQYNSNDKTQSVELFNRISIILSTDFINNNQDRLLNECEDIELIYKTTNNQQFNELLPQIVK